MSALPAPAELRIYDPYFCAGTMKAHLASLGFNDVYNENEDFYQTIAQERIPEHHCLITNPPFGEEHMRRLIDFVLTSEKPFCLLLPEYVRRKPYFKALADHPTRRPILLCPHKRYHFWSPIGEEQLVLYSSGLMML